MKMYVFCYFFPVSHIFPIWVFCVCNARNSSFSLSILFSSFNYCLILSFKELVKNRLVTVSTSSHLLFSASLQGWPAFFFELHIKNSWRKNSICLVNISSVRRQCQILNFFFFNQICAFRALNVSDVERVR